MPDIEQTIEQPRDGLRVKYDVRKAATGEPVEACFVLRPDRDAAARVALLAYAQATDNYDLRADLHAWAEALIEAESPDRTAAVRIEVHESQVAAATEKAVRARQAADDAEHALTWATEALDRARNCA